MSFSKSYLGLICFIIIIVSQILPFLIPCVSFSFFLRAKTSNTFTYLPIYTLTTGYNWTGIQHICIFTDCLKNISKSCAASTPFFRHQSLQLFGFFWQRYLRIFPQNNLSIKYTCVLNSNLDFKWDNMYLRWHLTYIRMHFAYTLES